VSTTPNDLNTIISAAPQCLNAKPGRRETVLMTEEANAFRRNLSLRVIPTRAQPRETILQLVSVFAHCLTEDVYSSGQSMSNNPHIATGCLRNQQHLKMGAVSSSTCTALSKNTSQSNLSQRTSAKLGHVLPGSLHELALND